MKTKFLTGLLIVGIALIAGCIDDGSPAMVKIADAKLESGSFVLSLEANQSLEKVRVELVDEEGQVLCTRYKDLVGGVTEFELKDCEIRKKVTVTVTPPGGGMKTRDFRFELPGVRIKDAKFEGGNIFISVDADAATDNVRIDVVDESDQILCTGYEDLVKGISEVELTDCEIKERITVSVSPPKTGIITRDFTITLPEVRIMGVKPQLGKLVLSLDANMDISDAKIYVFGKDGAVLCTGSENFAKGPNERELSGCLVQKEITVSVSSPAGKTTTRDFTLELPLLELKPGLIYRYALTPPNRPAEEAYLDVYLTKGKEREGIIVYKKEENGGKKVWLLRFKLDKETLSLVSSYPLGENEIPGEDVQYIALKELTMPEIDGVVLPFILSLLKEMGSFDINQFIESGSVKLSESGGGGPGAMQMSLSEPLMHGSWLAYEVTLRPESETQEEIKFFISAAEPYLLINISGGPDVPRCILEKVEARTFDISEYDGYDIEVKEIRRLDSFCDPDGVAGGVIRNTGRKPVYTGGIEVLQVKPEGASTMITWDKEVIQPGESATFRDQCGEKHCLYQLTSPGGTAIQIGMDCAQLE